MSNTRLTPEQAAAAQKRALEGWRRQGTVRTHILSNQEEVLGFGQAQTGRGSPKPARPGANGGRAVPKARSALEITLQAQIEAAGLPKAEYDVPYLVGRAHRLDVCWADRRLGVEVQGQVHRIKGRFRADMTKRALGLIQGWRVLEVDREAIKSGKALEWIKKLLPGLP